MPSDFVHLRVHTEFSLRDGLVRVEPLVRQAVEQGMPAVAVTDHANLFALVKFYAAARAAGIKPVCGADLWVREDSESPPCLMTLLIQNDDGYRNLTRLVSRAWLEGQDHGEPYVRPDWVVDAATGLIALSGGRDGDVGRLLLAGHTTEAAECLAFWQRAFPGRYYLELQRTGRDGDEDCLHASVALAQSAGCPVVATNDVRFLTREEFEAHEARVCIHDGCTLDDPRRPRRYSEEQHLKSPEAMAELFSDIPEALANTVAIARRCSIDLDLDTYYLPAYPVPEGETEESFFRKVAHAGLEERLQTLLDPAAPDDEERRQAYRDRLAFELDIILQMGFPGYFLIVMDFIQWAKNNGIPVGPGRGSGAGSLVAYALKITDLDPLAYDLLFERFLNPERVSMPDFDVDFCQEGRDRVIQYVAEKYGRDAVSQIITYGTMAARAVVRDVARVQGKPYGLADRLSKLIPGDPGMTLARAVDEEPVLREFVTENEEAAEILDMAYQLEGITRNVGKHAGGVVIAPGRLTDYVPLYCDDAGEALVTQFDKDDVEEVGLVKFDFLGLRNLTIIEWTLNMVNAGRPPDDVLDIARIPLQDETTFVLLQRAETTAVFQLESPGMKDLIKRLQPSCFEDIIALVALFRPGPLQSGMVDDFINRKHGRAQVEYPHPALEPILANTYGVILYQEQVMQIAQVLAGYTLGQADVLRRAMGKKKAEEMARQRELFSAGAREKGVDERTATYIFDLMEKFAGYGFNKSHSAAYALVAYQTAWLKAHYPAEFMAASLSSIMHDTDKVVFLVEECRRMGLTLLAPDVNTGQLAFTVNAAGDIVYGLGAVKGLGDGPVANLIEARREAPFRNLFDFCERTDPRKVGKRALEALVRSGAFDSLGEDRGLLLAAMNEAVKAAEQSARNADVGMVDLFGGAMPAEQGDVYQGFRHVRPLSMNACLQGEKDTLGLYLSGHPIDAYEQELPRLVTARLGALRAGTENATVAGLVVAVRTRKLRRGDMGAFVTLDDRTGRVEVNLFGEMYTQHRDKLVKDAVLVVTGPVEVDHFNGGLKINARQVQSLEAIRQSRVRHVQLTVDETCFANERFLDELAECLLPRDAQGCPVRVEYVSRQARACLDLDDSWRIRLSDETLHRLRDCLGADKVTLDFAAVR